MGKTRKKPTHRIVGASLAGVRAAEAMRQQGFEGRIVLVGAERGYPYHRPPLSIFAAGDVASTYSALSGRHLRIEQYGNAHAQGALVGRNMSGASEVHAAIPSTSTEQFGVRIQFIGRAQDADQTIMRGSEQGIPSPSST